MFELTKDQEARLAQFSGDKATLECLKRFFTNHFMVNKSGDVNGLAAERIALGYLQNAFKDLERMQIKSPMERIRENTV